MFLLQPIQNIPTSNWPWLTPSTAIPASQTNRSIRQPRLLSRGRQLKKSFHSNTWNQEIFTPIVEEYTFYTFLTRTFLPGTAAYMKKTQKPKLSWKLSVLIRNSINTAAVKLTNTTATHPRLVIQTAENGQDSNPQSFRNGLANHIFQATHEVRNSAFIAKIASRLQNSWTFVPIMP